MYPRDERFHQIDTPKGAFSVLVQNDGHLFVTTNPHSGPDQTEYMHNRVPYSFSFHFRIEPDGTLVQHDQNYIGYVSRVNSFNGSRYIDVTWEQKHSLHAAILAHVQTWANANPEIIANERSAADERARQSKLSQLDADIRKAEGELARLQAERATLVGRVPA